MMSRHGRKWRIPAALRARQCVKEIEDIVFKEKKGYITDPIKVSPTASLILRIEERYEAGTGQLRRNGERDHRRLACPEIEPRVRELLTRLRHEAFLEIRDGYVDSGAAPGKDTRWQRSWRSSSRRPPPRKRSRRSKKRQEAVVHPDSRQQR